MLQSSSNFCESRQQSNTSSDVWALPKPPSGNIYSVFFANLASHENESIQPIPVRKILCVCKYYISASKRAASMF